MTDKKTYTPGLVYPTMITPYNKDGSVDFGGVRALTEWYYEKGCDGIFAACQSSEIVFLSEKDRVGLAKTVLETAQDLEKKSPDHRHMGVVASGHISYDFDEQVHELCAIADTGVEAVILISNRMDIADTSEDNWIRDTERLINMLPAKTMLGTYECPLPYKRLMTDKMMDFCAHTNRFAFMKDTCCDAEVIARRIEIIKDTPMKLLNANGPTLLQTLRDGAAGYSGIMANFHPELIVWLCHNFMNEPEKADLIQSFIGTVSFTENLAYPVTAKYHLKKHEGLPFESLFARSCDERKLTKYHTCTIDQMKLLADTMLKML